MKIFRKIRQKLLSENRLSKYLIYAIGEIVLVVIGILLALQINNWNENRKNTNQIETLLTSLNKEVIVNKDYLSRWIQRNDEIMKKLKSTTDKLNSKISDEIADSLINVLVYSIGEVYDLPLSNAAIDNFNNSNLINDIHDESLKNYILFNNSFIDSYKESYKALNDFTSSTLNPYLFKNANKLSDGFKMETLNFEPQNFSHNREAFVKNREFTNLITEYIGWMDFQNKILVRGEDYFRRYSEEIDRYLEEN